MEQDRSKPFRYSGQQKQNFLADFKESGMTVKEFCKARGVSESAFRKWQVRERRTGSASATSRTTKRSKATGFAELQIAQPSSPAVKSVLYAEVRSIKIYQPVSASYIKELQ
jgi:transposase-like protein